MSLVPHRGLGQLLSNPYGESKVLGVGGGM